MPIFDFLCEECDNIVEEFVRNSNDVIKCPMCQNEMIKLPGIGSFHLKYDPSRDTCDWQGNSSHYYDAWKQGKEQGKRIDLPEKSRAIS